MGGWLHITDHHTSVCALANRTSPVRKPECGPFYVVIYNKLLNTNWWLPALSHKILCYYYFMYLLPIHSNIIISSNDTHSRKDIMASNNEEKIYSLIYIQHLFNIQIPLAWASYRWCHASKLYLSSICAKGYIRVLWYTFTEEPLLIYAHLFACCGT